MFSTERRRCHPPGTPYPTYKSSFNYAGSRKFKPRLTRRTMKRISRAVHRRKQRLPLPVLFRSSRTRRWTADQPVLNRKLKRQFSCSDRMVHSSICTSWSSERLLKCPLQVVRRDSDFSIGILGSSEFKPPAIWWIHGHSKIHLIFNLLFWPTPVVYSR